MGDCCNNSCASDVLAQKQRKTLTLVLIINGAMFFVIVAAALVANSSALLADSFDNLGDAITYGLSLLVVAKSAEAKARVALFKGLLIFLAASLVSVQILHKLIEPTTPIFTLMGGFGLMALAANSLCLLLLWRHRNEDINMSSVWECSRNDIIGNLSVFFAAALVWATQSGWPDLVVAAMLVVILFRSSAKVIRRSWQELKLA